MANAPRASPETRIAPSRTTPELWIDQDVALDLGASEDEVESEIAAALLSGYDIAGRAPKTRIVDGWRLGKGECAVVSEDASRMKWMRLA